MMFFLQGVIKGFKNVLKNICGMKERILKTEK